MKPEQVAEAVRVVSGVMEASQTQILDALIARLLTPAELRWRDARAEAPPEDVLVLVVEDGRVGFARYLGENGQSSRRLPNASCWGYWMTLAGPNSSNTYESAKAIRWWMPVPLAPESP